MTSPLRRFSVTKPDGTLKTGEELQADADELIRDARARGERVRTELAANVVEARSTNQAATVTVTASGALKGVRLNDRIEKLSPVQVAASIMEAYREAAAQAAARTTEIAGREFGAERARQMFRNLDPDSGNADSESDETEERNQP